MNPSDIQSIIDKHDQNRGGLISMLQEIQARYSYLPKEVLSIVAEKTNRSLVDIYGVATFYKSFSLTPRGKHLCAVCVGTACHVRGAPKIAEEFERQLGINAGETTEDREFTLETVNCLGACALGPIVVVDGHYFSNVKTSNVKQILNEARTGLDKVEVKTDERIFPVEVSCSRCNHSLMDAKYLIDDQASIRVTVSFGRKHGALRLSSLYGSYNTEAEYEIPENKIIDFFCPHCHAELRGASECTECSAPMVPMIVRGGGIVQICSRSGCKGHLLDFSGINV
ncbi:MAG: NAD(P)H-dependent oxidoreductase subunit E [Candidatus Electryoneaceae bacterium]|nr:NAD(P)H-dependent oxidoreductase subunit E [Candidatus Electryoneaceae bacterium]